MELHVQGKHSQKDLAITIDLNSRCNLIISAPGVTLSWKELTILKVKVETGLPFRHIGPKFGIDPENMRHVNTSIFARNGGLPGRDEDAAVMTSLIVNAEDAHMFEPESLLAFRMIGQYLKRRRQGNRQVA